ncbi:putative leucine-rich repeat receptor-like protein kinase [Dorcoceras hygrometricum]|uniref:Putative leucine-rich repeat receptor-like protein kinase n=1 Tax=Dorcoceras hygrometricum TaxID=472368 RepID=A0A2Z7DFK4_9LAMI|nr:putative leucine-rich repeat receptor-like protein kinase [Dorcoceras hygrometricum]
MVICVGGQIWWSQAIRGLLVDYPAWIAKRRRLEETRFEMRKLLAVCEPAWFEGLVWTDFGLSKPEGSAMSFWVSVNAGQCWCQNWSFRSECFG